jgi:hypoxanthine phosphoribosyltransferase
MLQSADGTGRNVMEIDWAFFGELCRGLALRIARDYDPDVVLGVTKAGVIPGVVVASILGSDFAALSISRGPDRRTPTLLDEPSVVVTDRRVLIVDETCDSGETLRLAVATVRKSGPAELRTAVSFRTGAYAPDYHALATESLIILPWDREVVVEGELAPRPEYAAWLAKLPPDA